MLTGRQWILKWFSEKVVYFFASTLSFDTIVSWIIKKNFIKIQSNLYKRQCLSKCKTSCRSESSNFNLMQKWIKQLLCCPLPPHPTPPYCLHCTCSEVLCLGMVTFEQGVAWPTVSYSMAVRPIEEYPCALRGKGSQIKYATKVLRDLLHAKPNISPFLSQG